MIAVGMIILLALLVTWWAEWRQSDRETSKREVRLLADSKPMPRRSPYKWATK